MSVANNVIGIIFIVAVVLVYLPQYYKIVKKHTSRGFSPWFLMLGQMAASWTTGISSVYYINSAWICRNFQECFESWIGFGIILIQWVFYLLLYILYLWYLPHPDKPYWERFPGISRRWVGRVTFGVSHLLSSLGVVGIVVLLARHDWRNPDEFSDLTGYISGLESLTSFCFLVHYIPQIYEIYRLKSSGALSLISLALTTAGSFIAAIYLSFQGQVVENNQQAGSPFVWVPYLVVGSMQGLILGMGVYYDRCRTDTVVNSDSEDDQIQLVSAEMFESD